MGGWPFIQRSDMPDVADYGALNVLFIKLSQLGIRDVPRAARKGGPKGAENPTVFPVVLPIVVILPFDRFSNVWLCLFLAYPKYVFYLLEFKMCMFYYKK